MTRTCSLALLALFALATTGCPSTYTYPNDATGRYCRHRVEDCHDAVGSTPLTGADCVSSINGSRNAFPACAAAFDAESDCKATAACSATDPCAAEHTATSDCIANGGMGGGI
ncbi:MAG: hypothetical protein K1X94_01720 [Sandaracinaceae bacterium]|nr:hypothetical protein [Sandaracinaceae bacterium]